MAKKNFGLGKIGAIGGGAVVVILAIALFGNVGTFDEILAGDTEFTLNRIVGGTDDRGTGDSTTSGGTDVSDFFAINDFDPFGIPEGATFQQGEIICKLKNTVHEYDRNYDIIQSHDSTGVSGSPFFQSNTLISESGRSIAGYQIEQKVFCETVSNFLGGDTRNVVQVWLGEMTHRAVDADTGKVLVTQQKTGASVLTFPNSVGELSFNELGWIPASSIEASIDKQFLNVRIETIGEVFVQLTDDPSEFIIVLFPNNLYTDFSLEVENFDSTVIPPPVDPPTTDPIDPILLTQGLNCDFADGSASGIRDCKLACEEPTMSSTFVGRWVKQTVNIGGEQQDQYSCDKTIQIPDDDGDGVPNSDDLCSDEQEDSIQSLFSDGVREADAFDGCSQNTATVCNGVITGKIYDTTESCTGAEPVGCDAGESFNSVTQQCEVPDQVITIEDEVEKGSVISIVTVQFVDGTDSQTVAQSGLGNAFPDLQTNIGDLTPAVLVPDSIQPTGSGISNKAISFIKLEMIYLVSSETPANSFGLDQVSLKMTPTVNESSVSRASGTSISFRNADIGSPETITVGGLPLGNGFSLGTAQVTVSTLLDIGEDANILAGQSSEANIILSVDGSVDFTTTGQETRFNLDETTVTFKDFLINNSASPVTEPNCTDDQVPVLDANGKVVSCREKQPTDSTCITPERPSGFNCSPQFVEANCPNGINACVEPDGDGDGVPDFKDKCKNSAEDGIDDGLAVSDDGCPAPSTPKPTEECEPNSVCKPDEEPPDVDPPVLCSEANPEKCIVNPEDFTTIALIGGIIIVVIGVIIVIVKRRSPRIT